MIDDEKIRLRKENDYRKDSPDSDVVAAIAAFLMAKYFPNLGPYGYLSSLNYKTTAPALSPEEE